MAFEEPLEQYNGKIREVTIGGDGSQVVVGGETALPFCYYEGEFPRKPIIAMEVFDISPEGWPAALVDELADVMDDPVSWAKKCENEYKADAICVQLVSTDPNGKNKSSEEAAATVKALREAVSVPMIVYGSGSAEKDADVLKKVAGAVESGSIVIGPAVEDNYKPVTAAAMGYNHVVSGNTPIDVNMAKQLNILMTQLGLDAEKIIIDPTTGALGYGLEYSYSVMERLRLAALQQDDKMTQMPLISNLGKEAWRAKEAKIGEDEEPAWGDAKKRGILWEAITAMSLLLAGADILVMRHPESVKLVRQALTRMTANE